MNSGSMKVAAGMLAAVALAGGARAAVRTTSGAGSWTNAATWVDGGTLGLPAAGDDVVVIHTVTNDLTTPELASFSNTATVVFLGTNTALRATNVTVNGIITHPAQSATAAIGGVWYPDHRVWIVCSNLTVVAGKSIDANGKGYAGGGINEVGRGPGGGTPESRAGGGAYGGRGGGGWSSIQNFGLPYGVPEFPFEPGSGGAGRTDAGSGRSGGGLIRIEASGLVTVNGTITANGGTQTPLYSGGSGGGISIACRIFGGSGVVSADGSAGNSSGDGAGGGGRIAIAYNGAAQALAPVPSVAFSTSRGLSYSEHEHGRVGTIWLPDDAILPESVSATVPIKDALVWGVSAWSADTLSVNGATLNFQESGFELRVNNTMTLTNGAVLHLRGGITNALAGDTRGLLQVGGALAIHSNSVVYLYSHPTNGGSVFCSVGSLTLHQGATINADGTGFAGGGGSQNGYGPGKGLAGAGGSGAGHGGTGGTGWQGTAGGGTYGSSNAPVIAGSGGGGRSGAGGAAGGGLIRIEAQGALTVNGLITANGSSSSLAGAGSGGGIYLRSKSFGGTGVIRAKGGDGNGSGGGGGGGGRIAICRTSDTWTGVLSHPESVSGGTYYQAPLATAGTIVWGDIPPGGTLIIIR